MSALPRRGFLSGLVRLPLIGGGVSLIGAPTASAEPITQELLHEYSDWLGWERARICRELFAGASEIECRRQEHVHSLVSNAFYWHFKGEPCPPPSQRAALILSTVGTDWRGGIR